MRDDLTMSFYHTLDYTEGRREMSAFFYFDKLNKNKNEFESMQ